MEQLSGMSSIIATCVICATIALSTALPVSFGSLGEYNGDSDSSKLLDTCAICISYSDAEACALCNFGLADSSIEKRSGRFHPLLRGGYPKKNTYFPYYNPLTRGSYPKKSFNGFTRNYHPFLRGGYRVPDLPQRSYWNTDDDVEEP